MMGGDGPNSYAQNSEYQKQLLVSAEDLIHDLIHEHLDTENPTFNNSNSTIRIADFGCSFYGRLFPKATLHFAHCSTALHWLSRIPVEVTEKNSIAWNKGRVHYSGAGKEVKEAYSSQYKEDFETFLSARADELVDGGLMVLVILGFPDGALLCESSIGLTFDMLGSCFQEMAKMGKISEEKVDSFNLPFYYPSPSELKAMIEANGLFNIVRIAKLASPMRAKPDPQILTSHLKAVIGVLVEEHFGNGMMIEELFRLQFEKMVESPVLFDGKLWKEANYFVFLKRNARSVAVDIGSSIHPHVVTNDSPQCCSRPPS
ncbi:hypothetical protein DH2020_015966 [Rehmannia glutinosa]|uniref:S-adenosylmethionine-dependent methyltransferase n=1 Tax=Rehmannia glutinosa TaxID=99300 RepID=A0ABR0WXN7_REHGL